MVANFEKQRKFAKWVLNVGDGSLLTIAEEEGVNPDWIKIPSHMRLPVEDYSLRGLIRTIYPITNATLEMPCILCNVAFWDPKILTLMKSTM